MAAGKIFSIRQLPIFLPSTCWNTTQRNFLSERTILKRMGYPEKPKKPSLFLNFVSAKRPAILSQNPNMSLRECTALLGKQWKDLPESEKKKFSDIYAKQFAEYKTKLEEYNKSLTDKQKQEMKEILTGYKMSRKEKVATNEVKKLEKQLNKPKSPVSPYFVYFSRNYEKFQGGPASQVLKVAAEKWRNSPESEKQKYKAIFDKEYEQYKKDLEKWENKMMEQGNLDVIRVKTLKKKLEK